MARYFLQGYLCVLFVVSSPAFSLPPSPAGGNFFNATANQPDGLELSWTSAFGQLTPEMTIETWIFFSQKPPLGRMVSIVRKKRTRKNFHFYFVNAGKFQPNDPDLMKVSFAICDRIPGVGGGCGVTQKHLPDFQINQWHHVALTHSQLDGEIIVYIDGIRELHAVKRVPIAPVYFAPEGVLQIGGGFDGAIDEFRISNKILYEGEFKPPRRLHPNKSTLALWHFDEWQNSAPYHDASGKGNTLFNPIWSVQPLGQWLVTWGNLKQRLSTKSTEAR